MKMIKREPGVYWLDDEARDLMPCRPNDVADSIAGALNLMQEYVATQLIKPSITTDGYADIWCGVTWTYFRQSLVDKNDHAVMKDAIQTMV